MISDKSRRLAAALRVILQHSATTGGEDVIAFACVCHTMAERSSTEGHYPTRGAALTGIVEAIVSAWAELDKVERASADAVADALIAKHVGKPRT